MSEIPHILEKLEGTLLYDTLTAIEKDYQNIYEVQKSWYEKTQFTCPDGCGTCCVDFEPDILESEALYMGAWIIENIPDLAEQISQGKFPFDNGKTCPLWNREAKYHCSIYGGRPMICRLFGASSFYDKDHNTIWRPCRFFPDGELEKFHPNLKHKTYSENETISYIGAIPPVMSDLLESSSSFGMDSKQTFMLREILPDAINKILWIIHMNGNDNPNGSPNGNPNGSPNAPMAA